MHWIGLEEYNKVRVSSPCKEIDRGRWSAAIYRMYIHPKWVCLLVSVN